jgi:glycosyltransferase involved in cell wall biosynthesis
MGYPISVIVPHMEARAEFLRHEVLPAIVRNHPSEIIVIADSSLNAQQKRNTGARAASQPFLFFCDDDAVLRDDALGKFLDAITLGDKYGFSYSNWSVIVHPGVKYPYNPGVRVPSGNIVERLKYESPLCSMCLIRREAFPGWDENLRRHQDRDLFLSIFRSGWSARFVPQVLVDLHQIDSSSITQTEDYELWERYIELKHGLPPRLPSYKTPCNLLYLR